jgi:methionine-R-sulfoxide reductase
VLCFLRGGSGGAVLRARPPVLCCAVLCFLRGGYLSVGLFVCPCFGGEPVGHVGCLSVRLFVCLPLWTDSRRETERQGERERKREAYLQMAGCCVCVTAGLCGADGPCCCCSRAQAAAPSELHAEEHRRLQRGTTAFDTSCDAGENCKTMAACDVANGYPMTEVSSAAAAAVHPFACCACEEGAATDARAARAQDMEVFNTICLNNVYWAERAFTGLYDHGGYLTGETVGYYKCSCCGLPLYSSDHAYDAHSGWPAYFNTIDGRAVSDDSQAVLHNQANGELVCKRCGMHLGHRFNDGPRPTGIRDCIDSACLSFVPGSAYPQTPATPPPPPPPASTAVAPAGGSGEQISVYFGAGCYWHTQYDMYLVESDPSGPFRRDGVTITAHVGYAGGYATGTNGLVCYHSNMRGTLYSDMGHGEATEVLLDPASQTAQFNALLEKYFEEFRLDRTGQYSRLDPQDWGLAYRCMIGIPGGTTGPLYQLLVDYNRDHLNMELVAGVGRGDTNDEYRIYVYDTATFPFYRGEQYHQFHENSVLGRSVPTSYTTDLKYEGCTPHLPPALRQYA